MADRTGLEPATSGVTDSGSRYTCCPSNAVSPVTIGFYKLFTYHVHQCIHIYDNYFREHSENKVPKIQLTDLTIRNLKPSDKRATYYDQNLAGFGVRVETSGTKSFTLIYGANRQRINIGRVGIISLAEARKEAKRVLAEHTLGKIRPQNITYDEAKEQYLQDSEERNRPRTTKDYRRFLNSYFKYGRTPIAEIKQPDIKRRVTKLNSKPSEKYHAFVAMRTFLRWCVKNQYIDHSPMEGLSPPPQKSRDRILTLDELKTVLNAALTGAKPYGDIVALLILTGQRRGEISNLKWEYIDGDLVTLPPAATKNGREHSFPLSPKAVQIINSIKNNTAYLFPAGVAHVRGKPTTTFNGFSKAKAQFDETLNPQVTDYTIHDLRRSFSSALAQLGTPIHVTEKLLNHVSGSAFSGVAGVYNRYSYIDEMKLAVKELESHLLV